MDRDKLKERVKNARRPHRQIDPIQSYQERLQREFDRGCEKIIDYKVCGLNDHQAHEVSILFDYERRQLIVLGERRAYSKRLNANSESLTKVNALIADSGDPRRVRLIRGKGLAKGFKLTTPDDGTLRRRIDPVKPGTVFHPPDAPAALRECIATNDGVVQYRVIDKSALSVKEQRLLRGTVLEVPLSLFDVLFRIKNEKVPSKKALKQAAKA